MRLEAFDRRLDSAGGAPIAVAVSGGADSLLALIETVRWANAHGRTVTALSVDHGLQTNSGEWTAQAGAAARTLGCGFRALPWLGGKPSHGLPAAARLARHRLLADAAREIGAQVIVTGHTGDDALENAAMGLGPLAEWSASPVWPQGRGLCLLRPLLAERRDAIRVGLAGQGWTWIDDPANADARHSRIVARQSIAGQGEAPTPPDLAATAELARSARLDGEAIRLSRDTLAQADAPARRRVIAMAAVCAGGGERLPRGDSLDRLNARLTHGDRSIATLAGATMLAGEEEAVFTRNAGEAARGGLAALTLPGVWDGRYALDGQGEARPLGGLARRLSTDERRRLTSVPAQARPSLPVVIQNETVSCPLLADTPSVGVTALVPGRFLTACGVYAHERELERWAR